MTFLEPDAGDSSHVTDLRESRRAEARLGATLLTGHGKVTGLVVNLSRTGVCIESDKALADMLLAGARDAAGDVQAMVKVCLEVPTGGSGTVPVIVQARTVYIIHDQADAYRCGFEFRMFTEGKEALDAYLRDRGVTD